MMVRANHVFGVLAVVAFSTAAQAQSDSQTEVPLGLWQAEPDANGVVFHVRTRRCGRALCGLVERVKNRRGYDTPSNAVSAKVMWNMKPQPDGSFFGEMRGTGGKSYLQSRVKLAGNTLQVARCDANDCRDEVWKRLR